jgi:hypothetical protein
VTEAAAEAAAPDALARADVRIGTAAGTLDAETAAPDMFVSKSFEVVVG